MVLSGLARRIRNRGAGFTILALAAAAGCSEPGHEFLDDRMVLPATLFDALELTDQLARDWSENAYVTELGGGFTVMNAAGEARNHSFEYFTREGFTTRRLTVHLIGGAPWMLDSPAAFPDPPFDRLEDIVDSDVVVVAAINWAEQANSVTPDSIPVPELFAARLSSLVVWPEPIPGGASPDSIAWRVDFLEEDFLPESGSLVYWSTARFYFQPTSGDSLGEPVLPAGGRELYPRP
jgi:hypothetical protein